MNKHEVLTAFDQEVLKDQLHAHILLELEQHQSSNSVIPVGEVAASLGGRIVEERRIPPKWLMLKLETTDIQGFALRLAELGHVIIRGIGSRRSKGLIPQKRSTSEGR